MLILLVSFGVNANPPKHRKLKKVYYGTCAAYRDNMMLRHTGKNYKRSLKRQ